MAVENLIRQRAARGNTNVLRTLLRQPYLADWMGTMSQSLDRVNPSFFLPRKIHLMDSYVTFGMGLRALILLACFIYALSDRRLASRAMAFVWGLALLNVVPVATALLANRLGAGTAMGAAIGGLLILLSAGFVEGLWRRRRWVMVLLGFFAVMPGSMLFLQIATGETSVDRFFKLLSWLAVFGFSVVQLRDVEDAAEPDFAEPEMDEMAAVEGAV
jgi:hypothetical protein